MATLESFAALFQQLLSFIIPFFTSPFTTFQEWLTRFTSSFPLPPIYIIVGALILSTAFTCLVAETVIGLVIGFLLWKLGISKSWVSVEFRALKLELTIDNFELSPYAITLAYPYWQRIFPVELLHVETSVIRIKLDIFHFEMKTTVVDLAICFRISHQEEWNQNVNYARDIAVGYKHRLANHFSSIVFDNASKEPSVSFLELKLDEMAHRVHLEFENLDIRFVDYDINYSFGMKVERLVLSPGNRSSADPDGIGAAPKIMKGVNTRIYGNPIVKLRTDGTDEDTFFFADLLDGSIYVPDLFSCLLQPGFTPYGKGKRLLFVAKVNRAELNVHEKQADMVWFHFLRAFGFYEFRPWKHSLSGDLKRYERDPTIEEERKYIPLYRRLRVEKRVTEINRLTKEILQLETFLSICSIMRLRRMALGIIFSEVECHSQIRLDLVLPFDPNSDPQDQFMSRTLAIKRPAYEDAWCRPWFLHEIYLKELFTKNLIIRVYDSDRRFGSEGLPMHGGSLKTLYDVEDWTGELRFLFHVRQDGLCQGALREICEPNHKMLDIKFNHVNCKVIDMNIMNKSVFKCLLESRKRSRLRNVRQPLGRFQASASKGFQFHYRYDSKYQIDVDFKFAKLIVPSGLSTELDETNLIVYRGFWANAKATEIFLPKDLCPGASYTAQTDIFTSLEISRGENELLLFGGRNVTIKLKVDSLDMILFETLYSLESKCQRIQAANISVELNTGNDSVSLNAFTDYIRLKQWYPGEKSPSRSELQYGYSKFLDSNSNHSIQSSHLLEIDKIQVMMENIVSEGDNSYLKTLCSDYWNGEYERLSVSFHIHVDASIIDHGTTNFLGYKTLESLRLVLSYENFSCEYVLALHGKSSILETDLRVRKQIEKRTTFSVSITGVYIDPEKGVDNVRIGATSFSTPILSTLNLELKNSDGISTGSIR